MVGIGPKLPPSRKGKLHLASISFILMLIVSPRLEARTAAESAAAHQGFRGPVHRGPREAQADRGSLCEGAREGYVTLPWNPVIPY